MLHATRQLLANAASKEPHGLLAWLTGLRLGSEQDPKRGSLFSRNAKLNEPLRFMHSDATLFPCVKWVRFTHVAPGASKAMTGRRRTRFYGQSVKLLVLFRVDTYFMSHVFF